MIGDKEPMTLTDHRALGKRLHEIRDELRDIEQWLYGKQQMTKNHRAMRSLIATQDKLDQARSDFEDALFAQYHGQGATFDFYYQHPARRGGQDE